MRSDRPFVAEIKDRDIYTASAFSGKTTLAHIARGYRDTTGATA